MKMTWKWGIHPINWVGEDVREHGADTTFEQIVDDMQRLGVTGTEMGRKYPQAPDTLLTELSKRGLQLTSWWKSVLLSDATYHEQEWQAYREHVEFLHKMGSTVISTCEVGGSLHFDPRRTPHESEVLRLDEQGWEHLATGLNRAGAIAAEYGMKLAYHHHGGTVVERPEEIDRLMQITDPKYVHLLYDSGHAYYGGDDPLDLLRRHYDRIAYVHLKDIRPHILAEARAVNADFVTCIRRGVFTVPGDGCIDFAPLLQELATRGYDGWAMLEGEQDPALHPAYEYAQRALTYLSNSLQSS